jgi:hypothetical protein
MALRVTNVMKASGGWALARAALQGRCWNVQRTGSGAKAPRGLKPTLQLEPSTLPNKTKVPAAASRSMEQADRMDKATITMLCNPKAPLDSAVETAKKLMEADPWLDIELAGLLPSRYSSGAKGLPTAEATRLLDILDRISVGSRLVHSLGHLITHTDPQLRSKAALMLGRRVKNIGWARKHLADNESRVRANLIEALWNDKSPECEAIFLQNMTDPDNRVAGNAIYGLHLMGHEGAKQAIADMVKHPEPQFRTTAAWLIEKSSSTDLIATLQPLLTDEDGKVRRAAFKALTKLRGQSRRPPPEAG